MDILEIYRKRCSVRSYILKPIPAHVWEDILEAGRTAATSRGRQARRFVTITNPEAIAQTVEQAKMQAFLVNCSALVVGCQTNDSASAADVLISLAQMEATAIARGLGTLWLGIFDREVISQRIKLPEGYKAVVMMAFGYPAEEGVQAPKLPQNELFVEDYFKIV